ncbi:MAG: HAD family hydrolase [Bacteroidota bacterium]
MEKFKAIIFDWGNTLMRDFTQYPGPMAFWPEIEVIEGVKEVLKSLKGKYALCIATNAGESDTALMIESLKRGEIDIYFDYFFSSKDLGYKKPDPNFFKIIADKMNVSAMDCVMVGNDYEKDIVGAMQLNMKTIWFNEFGVQIDNAKCDFEIRSIFDLLEVV